MRSRLLVIVTTGLVAASSARGQIVELAAIDSKSIGNYTQNYNDNRIRVNTIWDGSGINGFVKFDFSSIPDGSTIIAMSLRTFHDQTDYSPYNDPLVSLYRVADDSWARGQQDSHPGLNEVLTPGHRGFPFGDLEPFDWKIDVNAADWSQDLTDDRLSICLRGLRRAVCYVYWYGSDFNPAPPVLTVKYRTDGFNIRITGDCPGSKTLAWEGAGIGQIGIVIGSARGSAIIPGGRCSGTGLGIRGGLQLYRIIGANRGSGQVIGAVGTPGTPVCGWWVQCINTDSCEVSNIAGPI